MNETPTVSNITYEDVAGYLRLDDDLTTDEIKTLNNLIAIARQYIRSWTGLTDEKIDEYTDFVIVVYILCQDMWDNRALYVDKSNLNHAVSSILDMHSVNLL